MINQPFDLNQDAKIPTSYWKNKAILARLLNEFIGFFDRLDTDRLSKFDFFPGRIKEMNLC